MAIPLGSIPDHYVEVRLCGAGPRPDPAKNRCAPHSATVGPGVDRRQVKSYLPKGSPTGGGAMRTAIVKAAGTRGGVLLVVLVSQTQHSDVNFSSGPSASTGDLVAVAGVLGIAWASSFPPVFRT